MAKIKLNHKFSRFFCTDNEKIAKLRTWQQRAIEANTYKHKMAVEYKGQLKKPGNGLMAYMAFQLSLKPGIFSVIIDERNIAVYFTEEDVSSLVRKVFGSKTKSWNLHRDNTSIQEQLRYFNSDKQIYFDKNITEHLSKYYFNEVKKEE